VGAVGQTIRYVEKKTCESAENASRIAASPRTMGAGFAEIGCTFESLRSRASTLRCSCGWGRLVCVMMPFSHMLGREHERFDCTICRAPSVEIEASPEGRIGTLIFSKHTLNLPDHCFSPRLNSVFRCCPQSTRVMVEIGDGICEAAQVNHCGNIAGHAKLHSAI